MLGRASPLGSNCPLFVCILYSMHCIHSKHRTLRSIMHVILNNVQIGCAVSAVLLQYLFLVSFMWMLMEGVVLYVVLVKVFTKSTIVKYYILVFTLLSYGKFCNHACTLSTSCTWHIL